MHAQGKTLSGRALGGPPWHTRSLPRAWPLLHALPAPLRLAVRTLKTPLRAATRCCVKSDCRWLFNKARTEAPLAEGKIQDANAKKAAAEKESKDHASVAAVSAPPPVQQERRLIYLRCLRLPHTCSASASAFAFSATSASCFCFCSFLCSCFSSSSCSSSSCSSSSFCSFSSSYCSCSCSSFFPSCSSFPRAPIFLLLVLLLLLLLLVVLLVVLLLLLATKPTSNDSSADAEQFLSAGLSGDAGETCQIFCRNEARAGTAMASTCLRPSRCSERILRTQPDSLICSALQEDRDTLYQDQAVQEAKVSRLTGLEESVSPVTPHFL